MPREEALRELHDVKATIAAILAMDKADPDRPVQMQRLPALDQKEVELRRELNRLAEVPAPGWTGPKPYGYSDFLSSSWGLHTPYVGPSVLLVGPFVTD